MLDLIEKDDSISDTQAFYITPDGKAETKQRINQINGEDICLESFLLGIWYFAIMRREGNVIGKATMNEWCPSTGGGPREYEGHMGENLTREVKLVYMDDMQDADVENEDELEHIDADIVEETKDPEPEQQPQTVNQSVINPVVINITMNQSGDGRQFGYIGEYHEKGED